ncbi:MAG: diguanylate cyclase, partial [Pseudomonadales bacterium]|nr:diguanylate cyclase [Pseudomonadales bacterium]
MNSLERSQQLRDLHKTLDSKNGRSLTFPPNLELGFQEVYARRYHAHIQLAGLLGLIALVATAPWDYILTPGIAAATWKIRIVASVLLMTSLAYSNIEQSLRYQQLLITLNATVCFITVLLISERHQSPLSDYYAEGSILVLIVAFVVSRLQFFWGKVTAVIMSLCLAMHLARIHANIELATIQTFVFVLGLLFALPGTYLMELSLRQNYLQSRLLNLEHKSLEDSRLQLEILTSTDGLTHIANRRSFDAALEQEWNRQQRAETPLSLIMLDVDNFKKYNDHYGHQQGDECLRQIARTLSKFSRRPGDLAARYGGEEFVLMLPGIRQDDAEEIAQQLVHTLAALALPHAASSLQKVTASLGVASMIPVMSAGPEQLILRADDALYQAKSAGRNRVCGYHYS